MDFYGDFVDIALRSGVLNDVSLYGFGFAMSPGLFCSDPFLCKIKSKCFCNIFNLQSGLTPHPSHKAFSVVYTKK